MSMGKMLLSFANKAFRIITLYKKNVFINALILYYQL